MAIHMPACKITGHFPEKLLSLFKIRENVPINFSKLEAKVTVKLLRNAIIIKCIILINLHISMQIYFDSVPPYASKVFHTLHAC